MGRGRLRIYLGAAPGVGKTFAMLNEGRRRAERGTDVVIGVVETHGRQNTAAQLGDLVVIPRRRVVYRGAGLDEMDLDAILARRPAVVLVDELAHTNAEGSRHPKRWQDVIELLDAGIDVISTVNIQHLESLTDVVENVTGVRQRETVPDWVVRQADQVELVDMTPEALRRRMAHGNIYRADQVDAALANYFRPGNLAALRELALLWLADKVDDALQDYMREHGIAESWATRERVVVALAGRNSDERLVRRAALFTTRQRGELVGVHIRRPDGREQTNADALRRAAQLLNDLGGSYREVIADDVAAGLVDTCRLTKATQLVVGAHPRGRLARWVPSSRVEQFTRRAPDIDLHVVSLAPDASAAGDAGTLAATPPAGRRRRRTASGAGASGVSSRRQRLGWVTGAVLLALLTPLLVSVRAHVELSTPLLVYLVAVCAVAVVGGTAPALVMSLLAAALANWFFVEPYATFRVDSADQLVALIVFLAIGSLVGSLTGRWLGANASARRARAEAEALATTAGVYAGGGDPLGAALTSVRRLFGLTSVAVLGRDGDGWIVEAHDRHDGAASDGAPSDGGASDGAASRPDSVTEVELDANRKLVLVPAVADDDRRVLHAFVGRIVEALELRELSQVAADAAARTQADELRTALLRAVSHDLRSPLASIKASATSLLQDDVEWNLEQRREFAETIDQEADRLNILIGNLLDMSRIEAEALDLHLTSLDVREVLDAALRDAGAATEGVVVREAPELPLAFGDGPLAERVLANVIANGVRFTPAGERLVVELAAVDQQVVVRVIDRGPGVPDAKKADLCRPFSRLGDQGRGVGLGLAVADGFCKAMGASLSFDDTPGGGLTVTVGLPLLGGQK